MLSKKTIQALALSFPDTDEHPHFDLISFRVNKKIFATFNMPQKRCTLKFDIEHQDIFTALGRGKIYAVPNAWGKLGWTTLELSDVKKEFLSDALLIAWRITAPKKYQKMYASWYQDDQD